MCDFLAPRDYRVLAFVVIASGCLTQPETPKRRLLFCADHALRALSALGLWNNFNNRTEESLGLAADSQKAAEKGLFGALKPWFGFFMLVEEAPGSTSPVRVPSKMPFPADPIFHDASYIDRYRIFFERMVAEKNYDAVALLTATAHHDSFHEPSAKLSTANLVAEIHARIAYIKNLPNDIFDELAMP